jgi:hypothetical protein
VALLARGRDFQTIAQLARTYLDSFGAAYTKLSKLPIDDFQIRLITQDLRLRIHLRLLIYVRVESLFYIRFFQAIK